MTRFWHYSESLDITKLLITDILLYILILIFYKKELAIKMRYLVKYFLPFDSFTTEDTK